MNCRIETLEQSRVLGILRESDRQFEPSLSWVVELEPYSAKLAQKAHFATAYFDDNLAGVIAFYLNDTLNQIYIPYVFVYEQYRNRSVASGLIDFIIRSNRGYTSVALEVVKTNDAALKLYRKLNFQIVEDREHTFLMRLAVL